jgi:hypothetical protein
LIMKSFAAIRAGLDVALIGVMVLTLTMLTGCGSSGSGSGGGGGTTPNGAKNVYVIAEEENGDGSILEFPVGSSGNVAPKATLVPPSGLEVTAVATDSGGQIYVGTYDGTNFQILVYPAGSTGSATPTRTILTGDFSDANLVIPGSMTIDSSGKLYVTGPEGSVAVYSATANGTATPVQLITSSVLTGPVGVAVDSSGDIYVSNEVPTEDFATGAIYVFAAGATGSATPIRQITSPSVFFGIALDSSGDIYASEDTFVLDNSGDITSATAQIVEFDGSATGAATPMKTLKIPSGGAPITVAGGLRIDSAGNLFVPAQTDSSTSSNATLVTSLLEFGPTATSSSAPAATFTSTSWTDPQEEIAVF